MLDLIYIIEEPISDTDNPSGNTYRPNFTIPGSNINQAPKTEIEIGASDIAKVVAKSIFFASLPFPLTLATQVNSLIESRRSTTEGEVNPNTLEELRLLDAYVQHHSMSPKQAKTAGYRFQPGHPVANRAYRKHPLSEYSNPENNNLYIPSDSYDTILLEERESELIKLLVHLGATKITITKKSSENSRSKLTAGASVQAGPMGGGEVNYTGSSEHDSISLDTREFSLSGRSWKSGDEVDRESFYWLSYEPSWKAVVYAREKGGCLNASIELKESTSFSTDKNLELSVKAKLAEVGAQAGIANIDKDERTYVIRAEFAPVQ